MWGLDSNGQFKSLEEAKGGIFPSLKKIFVPTPPGVQFLIEADLEQVRKVTRFERKIFHVTDMSVEEKRKRLIYLFQRDLMPGISQEVLDFTSRKDSHRPSPVSYVSKGIGWLAIFIFNFAMLFYIYLFAMRENIPTQTAWASSFGV